MSNQKDATEIARQTLKRLLTRKLDPTPTNYCVVYEEIANETGKKHTFFPERELRDLLFFLPKATASQKKLAKSLQEAMIAQDWVAYRAALARHLQTPEKDPLEGSAWRALLFGILHQTSHTYAEPALLHKRKLLEQAYHASADDKKLLARLQALVLSWQDEAGTALPNHSKPTPSRAVETLDRDPKNVQIKLSDLLSQTLEKAVFAQLDDAPDLAKRALELASLAKTSESSYDLTALEEALRALSFRLQFLVEDRAELRDGLLGLLQIMLDNVGQLLMDDRWMAGQITTVREIIAAPINLRSVGEARARLKEVVFKQTHLKQSLVEAKESLKNMLTGFVGHLSTFVDATSDYHDKIGTCLTKVSEADNIAELEDVLEEVIRETRQIQVNACHARDELKEAQARVEEAEHKITNLQEELDKTSMLVRHDVLTGALNRQGLEENFTKEAARATRRQSPLCVAMLDIDNFKKLNDSLGHDAGDAALIHLVCVIRQTVRPQDTVSRFGGEEFIILLPDTSLAHAETALVRLQRELTRSFFMHGNEKVLITFSAGITLFQESDSLNAVTKRADEAMYEAKKAGKNRVVLG